ncbi:F-box/WD repeat-containing protein 5-like isoform X2 [Crassostrea virginica]|uniref:Uncharacterized protein LOC111128198 n=1 Tax=Crassostrea virginica TaxID=6565 RepID=A0A8B8DQZ0_CRAVI|nr:uncharacterized protein LOC111128198 [Crassostrea virginica]
MAYNDWGKLTDPILLDVFSYLDSHDLITAAQICKNWYRVSQDETLWRRLVFKRLGCSYSCPVDATWKTELKRLIYHVPVQLHQTCEEHKDEIFYVCFSSNGEMIATCGKDGYVKVWKYGSNTELLYSMQLFEDYEYINYVEFNEANTHIIAHCRPATEEILDMDSSLVIFSITKGSLCPVAVMEEVFPSFRGTWLDNQMFLSASDDAVTQLDLLACKFQEDDIAFSTMEDLVLTENIESKIVLKISFEDDFSPEFVKVIDWSEWKGETSNCNASNSSVRSATSEKVVALYVSEPDNFSRNKLAFYRINLDLASPVTSEPLRTIDVTCLGLQLSMDHRVLVCNIRRITNVDDGELHIEKDVVTMVVSMQNSETSPDMFGENFPLERPQTSKHVFPSVSPDYLATESDPDVIFIWDRRSHQVISKLSHAIPGKENGVSAVAFHPADQEVLVTVSDDCKLRIWMSRNKINSVSPTLDT